MFFIENLNFINHKKMGIPLVHEPTDSNCMVNEHKTQPCVILYKQWLSLGKV